MSDYEAENKIAEAIRKTYGYTDEADKLVDWFLSHIEVTI